MVMTQYNTLNLKLSNSQLNKLKYGIKNETKWWNSNDEINFLYKLLLNNAQVSKSVKLLQMVHQLI